MKKTKNIKDKSIIKKMNPLDDSFDDIVKHEIKKIQRVAGPSKKKIVKKSVESDVSSVDSEPVKKKIVKKIIESDVSSVDSEPVKKKIVKKIIESDVSSVDSEPVKKKIVKKNVKKIVESDVSSVDSEPVKKKIVKKNVDSNVPVEKPEEKKKRGRKKKIDIIMTNGNDKIRLDSSNCDVNFDNIEKDVPNNDLNLDNKSQISFGNFNITIHKGNSINKEELRKLFDNEFNINSYKKVPNIILQESEDIINLKEKNLVKEWPEKTDKWCNWCMHNFNNFPLLNLVNYNQNMFIFSDNLKFCSFNCMLRYNKDKNLISGPYMLLKKLDNDFDIKSFKIAYDRETLKELGGTLSITEFRNNNKIFSKNDLSLINYSII